MNETLHGKVVFILEDDVLSALTIRDFVESLGCEVIGHARTLKQGMALVPRIVEARAKRQPGKPLI